MTEENSRLAQAIFCMSVEWLIAGRGSGAVQSRNWERQMMEVYNLPRACLPLEPSVDASSVDGTH